METLNATGIESEMETKTLTLKELAQFWFFPRI
jgi:hypothetical protein